MFGVVREFQPSLGVTHAVRGRFGASASSLATVFARKSSLDVYVVRANLESARLEQLSSTYLGATVVSLGVIRRTVSTDLLCVGFEHMRLAILSWHPNLLSWCTEQLVEFDKLLGSGSCSPDSISLGLDSNCKWRPLLRGLSGSDSDPLIRVDPSGHCLAVLSKSQSLLYVVPIRSEEDPGSAGERVINSSSIFVVDLPSEYETSNVKDFAFLHGMFEPHVTMLYETKRTWSGRTAVQRNTCDLLTISIDLRSKRTSNSWTMSHLPYDCYKVEAVPDSARGGILIISSSVIMQVRHGRCVAGLSLNCYGDAYATELRSTYEAIIQSDTLVECDAAHCRFLDVEETSGDPSQNIALLSLKGGELYFLHVAVDSQNNISMKRAGSTVIASEIVPVNERFFILSSRLSDSLLIEYKRVREKSNAASNSLQLNGSDTNAIEIAETDEKETKQKKRKRTSEEDEEYELIYDVKPQRCSDEDSDVSSDKERTLDLNENDNQGTRGVYDDDDELGFVFKSDAAAGSKHGTGNWALTVKDTITCFGPGADITMGPSPKDLTQSQMDMVVAGGYAKNGCLAVIHESIRPTYYTEFPVPGCKGVWTLLDPNVLQSRREERDKRNLEIERRNEARRIRNAAIRESRRKYLQDAIGQLKKERREQIISEHRERDMQNGPVMHGSDVQVGQKIVQADTHGGVFSCFDDKSCQLEKKVEGDSAPIAEFAGTESEAVLSSSPCRDSVDQAYMTVANKGTETDSRLARKANSEECIEKEFTDGVTDSARAADWQYQNDSKNSERPEPSNFDDDPINDAFNSEAGCNGNIEERVFQPHQLEFSSEKSIVESKACTSESLSKDDSKSYSDKNFEQLAQDNGHQSFSAMEHIECYDNMKDKEGNGRSPPRKQIKNEAHASSVLEREGTPDLADIELEKEEVLQLRRQVEASIPLEEEEFLDSPADEEEWFHSYMLLSTSSGTTILATGSDLEEVMPGTTDFVTAEETIVAGNVLNNEAIIQVVPSRVLVIMNGKKQCDFFLKEGNSKIKRAQICDPLILICTEDMQLIVLKVEAESYVESKSSSSGVYGDVEFDEYGMTLTSNESESGSKDVGRETKGISVKEIKQRLRNFSLTPEFSSIDNMEETVVSSAFLYSGHLASSLSEEGVLSSDGTDAMTRNDPDEHTSANGTEKGPTVLFESENGVEKISTLEDEDPLDDEDRMLYDDEEDKLLYGDTIGDTPSIRNLDHGSKGGDEFSNTVMGNDQSNVGTKKSQVHQEKGVVYLEESSSADVCGHLLVIAMKDGGLRILSRELKYATVFYCPYMYSAPSMATDCEQAAKNEGDFSKPFPPAQYGFGIDEVVMTDVLASYRLPGFSTPFLIFMTCSGLPVIYRAFMSSKPPTTTSYRSRLTFKRIIFRDGTTRWFTRLMKRCSSAETSDDAFGESLKTSRMEAVRFDNVSGRSGLFVGGDCPAFLFAERGHPRIHELTYMSGTGESTSREEYENGQGVLSFAELHNMNCPRGFVYVGQDHVVRIGALSDSGDISYDASSPFSKVALRCTPHKVAYHGGSATYGVLASMPTLTTREERLARILQSLEKHDKRHYLHTAAQAEAEAGDEKGDRVPPLFEELHELRIYRPDNWNLIRSHKLQKGEVGLAITNMKVDVYKQRMAGGGVEIPSSKRGDDGNESLFAASVKLRAKDVLVVGTGYLNGEDASSRGRLLLFEVSRQEIYTEAGGAYTAFQLQLIAEKEVLSPVTAVAPMEGYVIAGVGPLISVYKLVGDEIVHLSFAFGQLYCSSIASLKQYVLAADMCKSVSFMYFRERNNSVNFLGRDYEMVTSYATEFLIENENMSIIVSDGRGNLRLLNYAHAAVAESRGGKRLLMNGGIHIGSRVNKFMRIRAPDKKQSIDSGEAARRAGNQALMFATLDGGLGALVAVTETEFKRLEMAWKVIRDYDGIIRCGGVNVDDICSLRHDGSAIEMLGQNLLDSRQIYEIFGMTIFEMCAIGRQSGMKLPELVQTLLDLDTVLWRF